MSLISNTTAAAKRYLIIMMHSGRYTLDKIIKPPQKLSFPNSNNANPTCKIKLVRLTFLEFCRAFFQLENQRFSSWI